MSQIRKDYETVAEYAKLATTCIDKRLHDKSFRRQIPYKTPFEESRHWGRDKWFMFDSLPKQFRDDVNNDPGKVDDNLKSALELWNEVVEDAMKAMDRIVAYERALDDVPDWLKTVPSAELDLIRDLKAARIAEAEKRAAEHKSRMEELAKKRAREEERAIKIGGWYSYHRMKDGTPLSKVEVVDMRGIPPHLQREMMAKSKSVEFEKVSFYVPPKVVKPNYDAIDNKPPDKIHPNHVARGRNH
jgi:hypothetical protein